MPLKPIVRYSVQPQSPEAHRFHVRCMIPAPDPDGQLLRLPSWIPGSYLVRDFAKHVIDISAYGDAGEARVQRIDKSTVRCDPINGPLLVEYTVFAFDSSVRKAYLDERRGFFNGSSLLYCAVGKESEPCQLELRRPPDRSFADWSVATGLAPDQVDAAGFGVYRAESYAELIDHPVELGEFEKLGFAVDGIDHSVVLSGRYSLDAERLTADLAALCGAQREMFGGEPAQDRYLFLTNVVGNGYGGLEHRNSCALICSREDLPQGETRSKRYRGFLGLCSHEYFHQWNVKRIRPQAFAESDLSAEAYTRDLWHYEGVTSYYDDLFLRRAGLIPAADYLDLLAANATRVERTPGREVQSLADASFEAWTKFYQPDTNTPNATVSYYIKGALAALCIDLHLRLHGEHTLDDAMRRLWQQYGRSETPVPEGGLEAIVTELAGDQPPPMDDWLRGHDDLPLAALLAEFGIDVDKRAATSATDTGGRSEAEALPGYTGLVLRGGGQIAHVRSGTTGQLAGLSGGDELVAIDGVRFGAGAQKLLDGLRAGQCVDVHYFRGDELHQCALHVTAPPQDTWVLSLATADGEVLERRRAWIGE